MDAERTAACRVPIHGPLTQWKRREQWARERDNRLSELKWSSLAWTQGVFVLASLEHSVTSEGPLVHPEGLSRPA